MSILSDTIRDKLNENLKSKAKNASSEERSQLLAELTVASETRYRASLDSINRGKMYLTWMVEAGSTAISVEEQAKYEKFFDLKRDVGEGKAVEASNAEKAIAEVISNGTFSEQIHHSLIKAYYFTKNGQITLQKQIYEKESEVGNVFTLFVQDYIRKFQRQIQSKSPDNVLTLAKAMKAIKQDTMNIQDILHLNYQAMMQSVDQLQSHLDARKSKLEMMKKIIAQLTGVVEVMEEEEKAAAPEEKTTAPQPKNRMAIKDRI